MMNKTLPSNIMLILLSLSVFGLTTLSISNVDFKINDGKFQKSFLISGIIGADEASYIQASKIVDAADGVKATKDFSINTKIDKFDCEYQYIADSPTSYISTFRIMDSWSTLKGFSRDNCFDASLVPLSQNERVWGDYRGAVKVGCITEQRKFVTGYLSQSKENAQITTTISNGDKTERQTTTTNGIKTLEFLDATFTYSGGGLKTSRSCPEAATTSKLAIKGIGSPTFYLTRSDLVYSYKTSYNSLENDLSLFTVTDIVNGAIKTKIDGINNKATSLFNTKLNSIQGQDNQQYDLSYDLDKARITLTGVYPTLPLATIRVNADFVGIVYMCGEPQLGSLSDINLVSGQGVTKNINIKNVGEFASQFDIQSVCEGEITDYSNTITLSKGQSSMVTLNFNSNANKDVCDKCIITAQATNCPSNKATTILDVCSKTELECEEGLTSCSGNQLTTCHTNNWVVDKTCEFGCVMDSKGGHCIVKDKTDEVCDNNIDDDGDGLVDGNDSDCKKDVSIILIIMGLFGFIIGGLVVFKLSDLVTDNKYIKTGASIMGGLIIGIMFIIITKGIMTFFTNLVSWG